MNTVAAYEPPRSRDTHKIVFTLFKENEYQPSITQPFHRHIFSTRAFAGTNDLGPPLGAAFCYMQNETDDQNDLNESIDSEMQEHATNVALESTERIDLNLSLNV